MLAVLRIVSISEWKMQKSLKTDYENLVHVYLEALKLRNCDCGLKKKFCVPTSGNQYICIRLYGFMGSMYIGPIYIQMYSILKTA